VTSKKLILSSNTALHRRWLLISTLINSKRSSISEDTLSLVKDVVDEVDEVGREEGFDTGVDIVGGIGIPPPPFW
jgi:hypothetical protein